MAPEVIADHTIRGIAPDDACRKGKSSIPGDVVISVEPGHVAWRGVDWNYDTSDTGTNELQPRQFHVASKNL